MTDAGPASHRHCHSIQLFIHSYGITDLQYMQDNLKIEGGTLVVAGYDTKYSQLLSAIRARSPLPT